MKITPEKLAYEKGYTFGGLVKAGDPASGVKLVKDGKTFVVNQELLDDVASLAEPVENPDANSRVRAVQ